MFARCTLAVVLAVAPVAVAADLPDFQPGITPQVYFDLDLDTGWSAASHRRRGPVLSALVTDHDAKWLRLTFADVHLGAPPKGGSKTLLKMTSLADGAVQTMEAQHLAQWQYTSAYFNGQAVLVQVIADPGAEPSRVIINGAWKGVTDGNVAMSLCSGADQRVLATDPRIGRTFPLGCTAFLIDDAGRSMLTAGHCGDPGMIDVIMFNVPMSAPGGGYQFPPPQHQYAVDEDSIQRPGFNSLGNDWTYFGLFPNSNTGLRAHVAQESWFVTGEPPVPASQNVTVTGYGQTSLPVPNSWNGVLKTHDGPYTNLVGNTIRHRVDTTAGNSGSPIIDIASGIAFGIHTNGGCTIGGQTNAGMSIMNISLQNAIANPQGESIPQPEIVMSFPQGLPDFLNPAGTEILVEVLVNPGFMLVPGSAILHVDSGSGWEELPMTDLGDHLFLGEVPALECGTDVRMYVTAEAVVGETYRLPPTAPTSVIQRFVADDSVVVFADDFETEMGWTVINDPFLADGNWERGIPFGNGSYGDPVHDADGSSRCYLTANRLGESGVVGGATQLISPEMDATDPDAVISYFRWYSNVAGANPYQNTLEIHVSDNGGASWVMLEVVGPDGAEVEGGWHHRSFRIADIPGIGQTEQFRIRFTASDFGAPAIIEAGIDGVRLGSVLCEPDSGVVGDLNGDDIVDSADLLILLNSWGPCAGCPADLTGDGVVDSSDLILLLSNWT